MTKEEEKFVKNTVNNILENVKDILHNNTFICSEYLLKYISDKDEEAYNRFIVMFKKMTREEMIQVLMNVRANLIEQGKIKSL